MSLPLEAVCKPSYCSEAGGECAGRDGEQMLCHSAHRCKVFHRYEGPCAPSSPASARSSSHSEDKRTGVLLGDPSA